MNPNNPLEDRLERLGSALRERPALTERVMREVRQSLADGSVAKPAEDFSCRNTRRRWPLVTGTAAAIIAVAVIALILFPRPSVGWEDVKLAVNAQNWIRASVAYQDGQRGTIWLSLSRKIWAYKNDDRIEFSDGLHHVTYDFKKGGKQITKRRLADDDRQRMLSGDFGRDDVLGSRWLFGEKIVEQHRREVTEGGKTWIEFQLVFWRGDTNHGLLRVDPKNMLPASLLLTSPGNASNSVRWEFDYPTNGPSDVYAMGAPAAAKIDDRSPSIAETQALDGMAASRSRIGDFRLDVAISPGFNFYRVSRKGRQWRIDCFLPKPTGRPTEPAEGTDLTNWFAESLAQCDQYPRYRCDGKTVYLQTWSRYGPNAKGSGWHPSGRNGPNDLLSAEGHNGLPHFVNFVEQVYPDRFGTPGWKYAFDPHSADAPGCVVCKLSASLATAEPLVGHEWYYVDPRKGYAVVRAELFTLPPDAQGGPESTPLRSTIVTDGFRQSPTGFWYPTVIRETNSTAEPNHPRDTKSKASKMTMTIRYHFDFNSSLPDSLFQIDGKRDSKNEPGK